MTKSVNSATAGAAAVPRREPGTAKRLVARTDGHTFGAPISVRGRAAPGDVWELNVEDQAERDQGKVLPEDEGVVVREDPRQ
jgi:hypothetical protein